MRAGHEIKWILEGKSPHQIPMARLAEYMQLLAAIFGEFESVHFDRVEDKCTQVVINLDQGIAAQRVQSRVHAVRQHRAPADAMRAFSRMNEMVGEDKGYARITFGASVVLRIPGKVSEAERPFSLIDQATITGKLYAIYEEPSGGIRARIRPRGLSNYIACTADRDIGGVLSKHFLEMVRVQGRGSWQRSSGGEWACQSMHIQKVDPVKDVTLREAINAIRQIEVEWPDDPLEEWAELDERDGTA